MPPAVGYYRGGDRRRSGRKPIRGSKVAFAGSRDGVWNIYWVSIDDGSIRQLTDHQGNRGSFV
ncbi:MAG: hypothetical protein P8Y44_11170, partial [Acidobacteriota bacterium]